MVIETKHENQEEEQKLKSFSSVSLWARIQTHWRTRTTEVDDIIDDITGEKMRQARQRMEQHRNAKILV